MANFSVGQGDLVAKVANFLMGVLLAGTRAPCIGRPCVGESTISTACFDIVSINGRFAKKIWDHNWPAMNYVFNRTYCIINRSTNNRIVYYLVVQQCFLQLMYD